MFVLSAGINLDLTCIYGGMFLSVFGIIPGVFGRYYGFGVDYSL